MKITFTHIAVFITLLIGGIIAVSAFTKLAVHEVKEIGNPQADISPTPTATLSATPTEVIVTASPSPSGAALPTVKITPMPTATPFPVAPSRNFRGEDD